MNIFALDRNPITAARLLRQLSPDSKRPNKMITETQQMIAAWQEWKQLPEDQCIKTVAGNLYKTPKQIANHPVTLWVKEDPRNFIWLVWHLTGLFEVYIFETENPVKFTNVGYNLDRLQPQVEAYTKQYPNWCEEVQFFNYAKSKEKKLDFTPINDVHEAYKMYLTVQNKGK